MSSSRASISSHDEEKDIYVVDELFNEQVEVNVEQIQIEVQDKWAKHERPYRAFTKASKESGEESEDGGGGWYKYVEKRKKDNGASNNLSKSNVQMKNGQNER